MKERRIEHTYDCSADVFWSQIFLDDAYNRKLFLEELHFESWRVLSQDERLLDAAQELFERIWRGKECEGCRLRAECPMPLAEMEGESEPPRRKARALVRLRPRAAHDE